MFYALPKHSIVGVAEKSPTMDWLDTCSTAYGSTRGGDSDDDMSTTAWQPVADLDEISDTEVLITELDTLSTTAFVSFPQVEPVPSNGSDHLVRWSRPGNRPTQHRMARGTTEDREYEMPEWVRRVHFPNDFGRSLEPPGGGMGCCSPILQGMIPFGVQCARCG